MTVRDLIVRLQGCPPELTVRYNYDSDYDHPELRNVYLADDPLGRDYGTYVVLDEDERRDQ